MVLGITPNTKFVYSLQAASKFAAFPLQGWIQISLSFKIILLC